MSHASHEVLLDKIRNTQKLVTVGDLYVHYKNPHKPYKVLAIGLLESTEQPCIVYQSLETQCIWIRTLDEWLSIIETENGRIKRFEKYDFKNK